MFADDAVTGEPSVDFRSYDYCDQQSQCSSVSIDFSSFLKESGNLRGSGVSRGSALESLDRENEIRQRMWIRNSSNSSNSNDLSVTGNQFKLNVDEAAAYFAMNRNSNSSSRRGSFHKGSHIQFDSAFDEQSLADSVLSGTSFALEGLDGDSKLDDFALDDEFDTNSQSHPTMYEIGSDDFASLAEENSSESESEESLKDPPPSLAPLMPSSSFTRSEKRMQRTRDRLRAYSENPMRNGSLGSMSSIPRRNGSNRSLAVSNTRRASLGTSSSYIPKRESFGTLSSTNNQRRNGSPGAASSAHIPRRGSLGTSNAHIPRRSSLGSNSARNNSLRASGAHNPRRNGSLGASGALNPRRNGSSGAFSSHNPRRNGSLGAFSSHNPKRNGSLGASNAHNPSRNGSLGSMTGSNPRRNGSLGAVQKRTSNSSLKTQSCHAAFQRRAGSLRTMVRTQPGIDESEPSGGKLKGKAAADLAIRKIISPKMEKAMKLKLGSGLPNGISSSSVSRVAPTPAQRQHLLG